jgi:hypothetical protein
MNQRRCVMTALTSTLAVGSRARAGVSLSVILLLTLGACCGPCLAPCNPFAKASPPAVPIPETLLAGLSLGLSSAQVKSILGPPELPFTFYCTSPIRASGAALRYSVGESKTAIVLFGRDHLLTAVFVDSGGRERSLVLGSDPCAPSK